MDFHIVVEKHLLKFKGFKLVTNLEPKMAFYQLKTLQVHSNLS